MPQMQSFFGGADTQRSTNIADNRLINLYPTTNDKGDVTAFVSTPGFYQWSTATGTLPASGMYTTTNGRFFVTTGTSLYEIDALNNKTLRGTITSSLHYEMSDNGNELILVNGIDGWIFTFATNTLKKIKVFESTMTVTIASPAVVTTASAHGLVAGDRVILSSTGALPSGLTTAQVYYVISAGLGATTMQLSLTSSGAAINTSGVQSGVHTLDSDGYGFPNGATTVSYLNGRFICIEIGTQNFFCSEVLDGKYWDALNVQTADSNPDEAEASIVSHNELIVLCEFSGEVFYDSGTIPSPFTRNVSGVFEVGTSAPFSLAKIDNSIMWLGQSTTGGNIIYRLNGYTPSRISTYSIEYALNQMTTTADAQAFAYQQEGHHFYVITFPTGNKTFVYDANTQLWHERAAWDSVAGTFNRWAANHYAFFNGMHLISDYASNAILSLDLDTYEDNGYVHKWLRSWRCNSSDMKRQLHHKLTLEAEMGVANDSSTANGKHPDVMMRYSKDGSHTWSSELWRSLGEIGEYTKRVFWHRLGMTTGQPRIYEISGTAPVKITLLGAYLE